MAADSLVHGAGRAAVPHNHVTALSQNMQDNLSPLHVAAGMGHQEVCDVLLENGAEVDATDNGLYTALWRAAYYGHPAVVKTLLARGANKEAANKKGRKVGQSFSPNVEPEKVQEICDMLGVPVPPKKVGIQLHVLGRVSFPRFYVIVVRCLDHCSVGLFSGPCAPDIIRRQRHHGESDRGCCCGRLRRGGCHGGGRS